MPIRLKHPVPITTIPPEKIRGPLFHPGVPDERAWQAGNQAASDLQAADNVFENALRYFAIADKSKSEFDRKLALKSVAVELKTLVDLLPRLHSTIAKTPITEETGMRERISVSPQERSEIDRLYRLYNKEKSRVEASLHDIRNSIGAHHAKAVLQRTEPRGGAKKRVGVAETLTWDEIAELWGELSPENFAGLIMAAQAYLIAAHGLAIYEWYRFEENGTIRTHIPLVGKFAGGDRTASIMMMGSEMMKKFCPDGLVDSAQHPECDDK